jgi:two-component system, chemotaxis family, protein-glutamate methylesterase/glutaminase
MDLKMEASYTGTGAVASLRMRPPFDLVVVAASSGGLEALMAIFSSLPAEFPIPIAVVLHRSLQVPEMLATVLGRRTPLRVKTAAPDETPRAGTIYVAPPHRHLVLAENRTFAFQHEHLVHHTPSAADPLFLSAASVYRDRVVGVVLSGGDVDGAAGASAIGAAGGVVLAQNQATSKSFSMPAATIATGHVDAVLPPGGIATALKSLALTGGLTER